ncbi:MAG: isoprenyl transferase [Desulfosudaceae bacterium]
MNFNHSAESLRRNLDGNRLPAHIAIIMDGNGRWAEKRSLHRLEGHRRGVETIEEVVKACRDIPIPWLTLFAFSTENWNRPEDEVAGIMNLLREFLANQQKKLRDNGIRLNVVGERQRLPRVVNRALTEALAFTSDGTSMVLTIALSYGGRSEISRAARKLAEAARDGLVAPEDIDEEMFASCLYTSDLPDPDLLIRTSGEMRISNFLLWQLAYTEMFITDTLWPDFGTEELLSIIKSYQNRDRRFGKI